MPRCRTVTPMHLLGTNRTVLLEPVPPTRKKFRRRRRCCGKGVASRLLLLVRAKVSFGLKYYGGPKLAYLTLGVLPAPVWCRSTPWCRGPTIQLSTNRTRRIMCHYSRNSHWTLSLTVCGIGPVPPSPTPANIMFTTPVAPLTIMVPSRALDTIV